MEVLSKTRGKHKRCQRCNSLMKRLYIKHQRLGKKTMKAVGWLCVECKNVEIDDVVWRADQIRTSLTG